MTDTSTTPHTQRPLRVQEVAAELRVSDQTVYRLIEAGELAAFRVGRQYRVEREDVARLRAASVAG